MVHEDVKAAWEREGGWNHRHHITPSFCNDKIHANYKSFFDRPTEWGHGCPLSPGKSRKARLVKNPWQLPKVKSFVDSYPSTKVNIVLGYMKTKGLKLPGQTWGDMRPCNKHRAG